MKLPAYNFSGPMPGEEEGALRRVGAAAEGLGQVVEQGLSMYAQEMVKSQAQDAHLDLSQRLDGVEQELKQRQAIPVEEVKQRLGQKFDQLPEAVRNQPEVETVDPQTGAKVKKQADIPTWAIAGDLYDHEAEQALNESSKRITVGGWQSSFQRAALGDVMARRARMNEQQLQAMHQYQVETRVNQIRKALWAGDYGPSDSEEDLGTAGAMLNGSVDLLGTEAVSKLREEAKEIKITKPVYDALRMVTQPAYRKEGLDQLNAALASLGDTKRWTAIPPEKRASLSREVRSTIDNVQELQDKRDASELAFKVAAGHPDGQNPLRIDFNAARAELDQRFEKGEVNPTVYQTALGFLRQHVKDSNEDVKMALGTVAGQAMDQFMAIGPDGQPRLSFSNLTQETINGLRSFGKDGEEVLEALIRWDQANENHQRQMRQLPTAEQDARALAIERAVRRDPGTFRSMPTADLMAIMVGKAPVPGEPDAPAIQLSSRDLPKIRDLLGENAKTPPGLKVVEPATLAQQEFEKAFGLSHLGSTKWGPKRRAALTQVSDEVQRWVSAEQAAGRQPTEQEIRDHLNGPEGPLQALPRKEILGHEYGPRTVLEAGQWKPPPPGDAGAAAGGAAPPAGSPPDAVKPPPPPAPKMRQAGEVVKGEAIGFPAGTEFVVQPNGKLKRVK